MLKYTKKKNHFYFQSANKGYYETLFFISKDSHNFFFYIQFIKLLKKKLVN